MPSIRECGLCGSDRLSMVLDMGMQPLAERQGGKRYPLRLVRCAICSLVQLDYIVDQREVFPPDHPYATGNTLALKRHFSSLAETVGPLLAQDDLVVDIGANDGTLLSAVKSWAGGMAVETVGVEPTDQARKCEAAGHRTWQGFFSWDLASHIVEFCGKAKLITATNVLAHVPDVHDFLAGVVSMLRQDGVFVTENHDLLSVTDGLQIDTVYHEHLRYYTVDTLSRLLAMHGLVTYEAEPVPTHGGSIRVFARRERSDFSSRAKCAATALRGILWKEAEARGKVIYGVGACTRATPLIHFAGIDGFITCVCEVPESEKIGKNMPGTSIPVVDESRLVQDQPDYALLFAWHIASDIIPKLRSAGYKGKFIIPLPEPKIVDGV